MNRDVRNTLKQRNSHSFKILRRTSLLLLSLTAAIFLTAFSEKSCSEEKLKVATCQFPVSGNIESNADYIKRFIKEAALNKADIVHLSEAALSGYPPKDIPSFQLG
jgi:hypothetical protein